MAISSDPPDDITTNILSRLPAKSLMQFRSVVKSWRDLIRDPNFINMHMKQTSVKFGYLILKHPSDSDSDSDSADDEEYYYSLHCDETFDEKKRMELPFNAPASDFEILGSCNGLILLLQPRVGQRMYLWNPSIRKIWGIPDSYATSAFSNSSSHVVCGFCFLLQVEDYRVVTISYDERFKPALPPKRPPVVEIYSLRTDSWSRIETVVPHFIINPVSKAFVGGSLHWVATRRTRENQHDDFIASFDMVREVYQEIKLPNCCLDEGALTGSIAVVRESLCLFARGNEAGNEIWEIWVMNEYGSHGSWSKQFIIVNREGISWPLGFMKNGEVILGTIEGELSLYDAKIQQVKDLDSHGDPDMLDIFPFMESLVLLDRGNNPMQ